MKEQDRGKLIERGVKIYGENNTPVTLNRVISTSGGQGDVYHATYKGNDYALKWYVNDDDVIGGPQYDTIYKIEGEKNKPSDRFIWPYFIVSEQGRVKGKEFGYLMPLLPEGYYEMQDFLRMDGDKKAVRFSSYNAMLTAGMNIARGMQELHLKGWSYKDLNPKNFAINPKTGDVLIVDNDNVSVDGAPCTVKGTKGYMAPEIPRSNYKLNPSTDTDYYSLAVVLYRLFFLDHPMDGKAWEKYPLCTDKAEDLLYAGKPVFHFDPNDTSNRPTDVYAPNAEMRWNAFPEELRDTFITAFTEGISNPSKRPTEYGWIRAIAKARDKLVKVKKTDGNTRDLFVDFSDAETAPRGCLELKINSESIAIYPHKAIYEISIDKNDSGYMNMVAGIVYDPKIGKLAIRNMSPKVWVGYSPSTGQKTNIAKGQEHPIEPGTQILFQRENPKIVGVVSNFAGK